MHLLEVTPEESAAAKARLDEIRKKRRERHTRKKLFRIKFIDMKVEV